MTAVQEIRKNLVEILHILVLPSVPPIFLQRRTCRRYSKGEHNMC